MRIATLITAAAVLLAIPAQAKMPFVKKAQEAGFTEVKDCKACHTALPVKKDGEMTERGKFLKATKAAKKAAEVDVNWLKDFKAN